MSGTPFFNAGQLAKASERIMSVLPKAFEGLEPTDLLNGFEVEGSTPLLTSLLKATLGKFVAKTALVVKKIKRNGSVTIGPLSEPFDLHRFFAEHVQVSHSPFAPSWRKILERLSRFVKLDEAFTSERILVREGGRDETFLPFVAMQYKPFAFGVEQFCLTAAFLIRNQLHGEKGILLIGRHKANHFYVQLDDASYMRVIVEFHAEDGWTLGPGVCGKPEEPFGSGMSEGDQLFLPPRAK